MTRRPRRMAKLLLAAGALAPAGCDAQARTVDARDGEALRRAGRYEQALAAFRGDTSAAAVRGTIRALAALGRWDEAEQAGRADARPATWTALGEVLAARGKHAAAESLLVRAGREAPDSLRARVALAELWWRRGEQARALGAFDTMIDVYNERRDRLTAEELAAVGTACRYLGERDPQLFKDALKAFDAAIARDSTDPMPRVQLAELFLSKYAAPDADETVRGALRLAPGHPEALLVAARVAHFGGSDSSRLLVRRALAVNPGLVDARVFLGSMYLDSENTDSAIVEAERALAVDGTSTEALAVLAAARLMRGEERAFAEVAARAMRPAVLYALVAETAARQRMYARAVSLARQGIAADSTHWRAQVALGLNLMRVGQPDEARRTLERAFAGDPYNVWVKNTLDLLDTYDEYDQVETRRFRFMLDRKESALLALYLGELMEDGYDRLAARYGYRPPTPVRLELFRSHADFSVRTVGLAGLGALGVSFGNVLAMDSPAARKVGEFNWASTAWHELAHAFTLGMTDHRVPRWLSEGLSVLEERRARPGWGAGVSLPFLAAYKAGALAPVSRLNDGFVRPRFPDEVILSYYQASLVCEMIEREWGMGALVAMLHGYRDGLATDAVVRRALKVEPAELDRRFDRYVRQRFATPLGSIRVARARGDSAGMPTVVPPPGEPGADDFVGHLLRGRALADAGRDAEALPHLQRAKVLFPELAGDESPRWPLARILEKRGDLALAAAELDTLTTLGEAPYEALLALARVREALGDRADAAAALERAIWVSPYDVALHQRLAGLHEATGAPAKAVREWRAVVALEPVDRAEALYRLALAYEKAGDVPEARRAVLRALEEAPNYERAQELLLRLRGGAR